MEPSVKPENPLPFFSDESAAFESLKAKGEELVSRSLSRLVFWSSMITYILYILSSMIKYIYIYIS